MAYASGAYINYGSFNFIADSGYPVPSINISQEYQRDNAGRQIGATVSINLEGKIYTGSGDKGFTDLLGKESGLRSAFSIDGRNLTIGCVGGGPVQTFSGIKVARYAASRTEDNWTTTIDYSIDLQSEVANTGSGIFYVTSTQDDWSIETIDEFSYSRPSVGMSLLGLGGPAFSFEQGRNYPFYRISRTIGAVGKFIPSSGSGGNVSLTGDKTAVYNAKSWVNYHLPLSPTFSGIIANLNLYNFVRSINTSESEGSYRITDNWMAIPITGGNSGVIPYTESFSIESALDSSLMRTITINGTVKGLESFNSGNIYNKNTISYLSGELSGTLDNLANNIKLTNSGDSKFDHAISGYAAVKSVLFGRATAFMTTGSNGTPSGLSFYHGYGRGAGYFGTNRYENPLNPIPVSSSEGFNPAEGSITYSWSFNNRPITIISGAISETLTIDDTLPSQIISSIYVLGRKLGPVLQDIGTVTSYSRSVTLEVVFPRPSSLRQMSFPGDSYKSITGVLDSFDPKNLYADGIRSFVKQNTENWNVTEGRFTKTKAWEYTRCIN
jgi:hypothetical protein